MKLHLPVAHLEAGLRSFNRRMPEEHNRVLTDHAADLLLAPTEEAMRHLADEGLAARSVLVGDVMVDVCLRVRDAVLAGEHPAPGAARGHRPRRSRTCWRPCTARRTPTTRRGWRRWSARWPTCPSRWRCWPTRGSSRGPSSTASSSRQGALHAGRPLPYAGMVAAVLGSAGVVTDSGGLQKEAYLLERPCTTLRTETEWVETFVDGWNRLVPDPTALGRPAWAAIADPARRRARRSSRRTATDKAAPKSSVLRPAGDGVRRAARSDAVVHTRPVS